MGWVDTSLGFRSITPMIAKFGRGKPVLGLVGNSMSLASNLAEIKAATLYGVAYKINHTGDFLSKKINAKSAMAAIDKIRLSVPNSTDHRAFKIPERAAEFEEYIQNNSESLNEDTKMNSYNIVDYTRCFNDSGASDSKSSIGDFFKNNSGALTTGVGAIGGALLARHLAKKKAYNDAIRSGASVAQAQAAKDRAGGFGAMAAGAAGGAIIGNVAHTGVKAYRAASKSDAWNAKDEDGNTPGFFNRAGQVFRGIGDQYKGMYNAGGGGIKGVANVAMGQSTFTPAAEAS